MCQPSKSSVSSSSSSSVKVAADDAHKASTTTTGVVSKAPVVLKSQQKRPLYVDVVCFLLPLLAFPLTPVWTVYLTGIVRMVSTHAFLSLHYLACDKDNYATKLSQKQLVREKKDYLVGIILHMWAQLALQVLFPGMFFSSDAPAAVSACAWRTFLTHVALVEPLYYAVHRWLHVPEQMKQMHGHHHMSVNTVPATSLVQNFTEHFIYIATFGPAMILPYFLGGAQHWAVILAYLVLFDVVNAYGHTNFTFCRHWVWESPWSPLRYLFYTPEFHLGHHHYYNCNYALFMPLWYVRSLPVCNSTNHLLSASLVHYLPASM
jgi:sterol desaturase/sphingolipid hydroxylase (fatty acid hydroxylase superfamily)